MSSVNFYLKKPEPATGRSLVYLQFKFNNKKLVFSFGQTINPKDWNLKRQRVKSNLQTTEDGKYSLNDLLDNLSSECEKAYHKELKNGMPEPGTLKKYLVAFMNQGSTAKGPTLADLIERFINGEIKHKGQSKSPNTLKTYGSLKQHLAGYEKKYKAVLNFDSITLDFYYQFLNYLSFDCGVCKNASSKYIQILKTIMNEAVDLGYTTNLQFKHRKFCVSREETDSVFLKREEIMTLYRTDLSKHSRLEAVRDLFVFGSFVGLRFSDYSQVKRENLLEDNGEVQIRMRTQKTNELVIIPCNPVVLELFKKYESGERILPTIPGNTVDAQNAIFNRYIKEACRIAGLTQKGRLVSAPEKELWECIGSHTARRSFATNLYLEGYPAIDLMKITGHRTEKAFMSYIRVSKLDAANRLSKHFKNSWSEVMLRIA